MEDPCCGPLLTWVRSCGPHQDKNLSSGSCLKAPRRYQISSSYQLEQLRDLPNRWMEIQLFPERAPEEGSEDDEVKTLQSISETLIPSSGGGQIVAHNSS